MAVGVRILGIGLLVAAAPVPAQEAPQCPRDAAPLPAEFSGWNARTAIAAAASGEGTAVAAGRAYDVTLKPDAELRLPNLPGQAEDRVGFGGIAHLAVDRPGTYRVALGSAAWVDLVRDGRALESTGHGHGPACSGIRKIVDFDLAPGRYLVTIDGNETTATTLLIARKP